MARRCARHFTKVAHSSLPPLKKRGIEEGAVVGAGAVPLQDDIADIKTTRSRTTRALRERDCAGANHAPPPRSPRLTTTRDKARNHTIFDV
jgi:hypothetical protein